MSYGLNVYLLDLDATHALIGSGDEQLLQVIRTRFADELAHADEYFRDEIENDGAPTAYEALRAVVHGGPYSESEEHASYYTYAYERLCSLTGSRLNNRPFSPYRGSWLSRVDDGLAAMRITAVSLESFEWSSALPGLPETETVRCGEWTPKQIARALEQFEATKAAGHAPPLEPEVVEAIQGCIGWLRTAEQHPGFGIVGFVY